MRAVVVVTGCTRSIVLARCECTHVTTAPELPVDATSHTPSRILGTTRRCCHRSVLARRQEDRDCESASSEEVTVVGDRDVPSDERYVVSPTPLLQHPAVDRLSSMFMRSISRGQCSGARSLWCTQWLRARTIFIVLVGSIGVRLVYIQLQPAIDSYPSCPSPECSQATCAILPAYHFATRPPPCELTISYEGLGKA